MTEYTPAEYARKTESESTIKLPRYWKRNNNNINTKKKFNIIILNQSTTGEEHRHCSIHPGNRLIQSDKDPNLLFCGQCGTTYPIKDTNLDQAVKSSIERTETKIVSGKRKRKSKSNVPEDIQKEIGSGRLLYYHEELP